jgi:MFS family permease
MSAHYAAEALTALYWNRLSDHIGRKPVLLLCLLGAILSAIVFGLSRSFWALVFRYFPRNNVMLRIDR